MVKLDTPYDVAEWASKFVSFRPSGISDTNPGDAVCEYLAECVKTAEGVKAMGRALEANGAAEGTVHWQPERIAENERLRQAFEREPGASVDKLYRAMQGEPEPMP